MKMNKIKPNMQTLKNKEETLHNIHHVYTNFFFFFKVGNMVGRDEGKSWGGAMARDE